jgi:hypothetical protein
MYVKDNWQKILMNSLSGMNVGSRLQGQIISVFYFQNITSLSNFYELNSRKKYINKYFHHKITQINTWYHVDSAVFFSSIMGSL